MGASFSSQAKATTKLNKIVDEHYLFPRNLFAFFEQYTRKQMKPNKTDAKVESALFSIIIDQILFNQTKSGYLSQPPNLESRIFDAISYQINSFIAQANPFADRFRFIEDNMRNSIQIEILKQETDWKQNAKSLIFDINSSAQTPTVLHAAFSVFFQVATINNFEKLSIESVDHLLENLNLLVTSPNCPEILGTSPQLISKFNSFIVNLVLSPKFAKNQIKSKVITFLLHISTIQGGICTVLAALTVGMSVQALTPFEGTTPEIKIGKRQTNTNLNANSNFNGNTIAPTNNAPDQHQLVPLYGTPITVEIQGARLFSACVVTANSNLLLVTSRGIIEVSQWGRILQTRDVKNAEDILITSSVDYFILLNKKSGIFQVFNYNDISLVFEENIDNVLNSKLNTSESDKDSKQTRNIIGIAFSTYLFILIETSFYEYDLLCLSIEKKTINFQSKQHLKLSSAPNFIFPGKRSVFLQCGDLLLKCGIPNFEKNKKIQKLSYPLSRVIEPPQEDSVDYVITASPDVGYVIKSDMKCITILNYTVNYGNVVTFPEFAKHLPSVAPSTFNSFLVNTISDMTPQLYQCVQYVFQKVTPSTTGLLQYFASSPTETINFSLNLGQQSLNSTIFPVETRKQILFFSLMLLTINGRCFISQYPLNQFEIEESDSILLNKIKNFVEATVFHPIATPEIIQAAFQVIKATFRYLYYPDYGHFREFLNGFKNNPRLLAVSIPFLKGSMALFYAIDTELLSLISPYLTHKNLHYMFKDRICEINGELHFLKTNNITSNEIYIANFISSLIKYYTDRICFPELFSRMQVSVKMILRIFTRVLVLDSAPTVSVSFAESCLRLLKEVKKNFTPTSKDISTDLEYSSVPDANETTQKKIETIETLHNYEDGKDIEWKVEMNGASEIEIEFDSKCATERNTDYLQIFDRAKGGSQFGKILSGPAGPLNWPKKLTIPSDSCRLFFHADESTNDWGIRLTISAHVPVATRQFKPDICLSMVNLICYSIGRSLQQALVSIPIAELEKEYKLMLESDILKGSSSIFEDEKLINKMKEQVKDLIANVNSQENMTNNDSIKSTIVGGSPGSESKKIIHIVNQVEQPLKTRPNRSKSQRSMDDVQIPISTYSSQTLTNDESRHLQLLNDLTAINFEEGKPANLLLRMLYKSSRSALMKVMPLSSLVERFAFAAFIRQLGMLNICSQTAMELVQSTANPSGLAKPPIHMNLSRLIKSIYKIRTVLHSAYQKSKVENRNPSSLRENYQKFAYEMLLKSKFLLISEPLLKGKEMLSENSFVTSLDSLVSFIISNVKFSDIHHMIDLRIKRAKTRIKAMDIVSEFIQINDIFYTSRISFIAPLINAFPAVVDKSHIRSISLNLMNDYYQHCSDMHQLFIDTISKKQSEIPNALRLFLLQILLFPTKMMKNEDVNIKSLLSFLSIFKPKTIDEIALTEGLWLFLTNIAIQNRTEDMCKYFNELIISNDNEYFRTKVITLQTIMVIDGFYQDIDLQVLINMMKNATPRLIVSILRFIASYFYTFGVSDDFQINLEAINIKETVNFTQLIEYLLQFIGKTQIYENLPILSSSFPIESHQLVSNEIVSFFRQLISQKSEVHNLICLIIQDVFTKVSLKTKSIETLFDNRLLSLEFLGLLIVFGNGMQPLFQGGYGYITSGPYKDDIMKITSYSPLANIVTGIILSKTFSSISVSPSIISSSSRIPPNPTNFDFLEEHFGFFERFHQFCLKALKSKQFLTEHRLLVSTISAFYYFIPMAIQSTTTMQMFLKSSDISSWINFSIEKSEETKLHSISELSLSINDNIRALSLEKSLNDDDEESSGQRSRMKRFNEFIEQPEYNFDSFSNASTLQTHLRFSILPSKERHFSPSKMVVLFGNGEINDDTIISTVNSSSVPVSLSLTTTFFVGDQTVPSHSQFYWECTLLTSLSSSTKFSIGFIDSRDFEAPNCLPFETFSIVFPSREIQSPTIGLIKLDEQFTVQKGDVFGVAYAQNHICFFRNGVKISRSIPSPHLGTFSPFISITGRDIQIEYNFGHKQFKTEFTREKIFDFCSECFIGLKTKRTIETGRFVNNSIESQEYLETLKKGLIVLDQPRNSDNETDTTEKVEKVEKVTDNVKETEPEESLAFIMKPSPISNFIRVAKGSPILVQRIHLTPKEVAPNELILFSTTMKEKLGQIGIVRELIPKESNYLALLEFNDPEIGTKETLKFDSRFLSYLPVRKNANTKFGESSLINRDAILNNFSPEPHMTPILTEMLCETRAVSIRMMRYSMLIVLEYFRIIFKSSKNRSQIDSLNLEKDKIVKLLAILILELTNFIPSIKIKSKWSHIHIGDSIFNKENKENVNNVSAQVSATPSSSNLISASASSTNVQFTSILLVIDPSKMSKVLKTVLLSIYEDKENSKIIFPSLFKIALDTLCSTADSAETLFKESPQELQFESTHPCNKVTINHTVNDPNAVGFVPILTSNCELPLNGITVGNITITGKQDDIKFIEGSKCELNGDVSMSKSFKGLSLSFLPIHRRLCDMSLNQSKGSIHLTFSLLSLIFSYNLSFMNDDICIYMKKTLLPSFLSILKDGGVLGSVFAFELIAPLLSHLEWNSGDLTESTLKLVHEYLKKFEDSVIEWKKLSVAAQHATLLKMLFDLTEIDASTRNLMKFQLNNEEERRKNLSEYYKILDTKLHMKPKCIFHEVTDAFTLVTALAHNWSFPIKFPSFLLLDSFLSSVYPDPAMTITDTYEGMTDLETPTETTNQQQQQQQQQKSYKFIHVAIKDAQIYGIEVEGIEGVFLQYIPDVSIVNNNTINDIKNNNFLWKIRGMTTDNANINTENNRPNTSNTEIEIPASIGQITSINTSEFKMKVPSDCKNFKIEIHVQKLTPEGRENLFITHFDSFTQLCEFMSKKWNQKIDETLLKIMNQNPQQNEEKRPFNLSHTQLASNSVLQEVPRMLLRARVELIRQLNKSVTQLLKCVDLSDNQVLSNAVIYAKSGIATSYKLDLFRRSVMTQLCEDTRINIRFNRSRAALHMINPSHPDAMPLLKQLIEQVPKRSLISLKRDSVPWHVDLEGEGATDAGGPARDLFTQTCLEIMHPSTGLFIMTPNKRMMEGPNQELLIPNSHAMSNVDHDMFIYSGVLMTIAYISRLPQPFKFAEFVWAHFTGAMMTIEDIYSIDKPFETLMRMIEEGEMDETELEKRCLTFTVMDSHGDSVELFPGGGGVRVTVERLSEYVQMSKKYRLKEMKLQLDWLKEGISYFFPPDALFLLSPWELELIVCGDNNVPVSELKKHCRFDSKDKSSKMLWHVLESFSAEERMLFIKFATGRMGLPPPGSKWHSELTITWVQPTVKEDSAMPLPTAATCSSTIRIPKYSTEEWMAKKIRAAIVFGVDIDTDRQVNFADIVQLS